MSHSNGILAQLVERLIEDQIVGSSILSDTINHCYTSILSYTKKPPD